MSFEKALIASASPSMVAAKIQAKINNIISNGCSPHIIDHPVALEPRFQPIWENNTEESQNQDHYILEQPLPENVLIRKRIWISPEQEFAWHNSESFIKMLESISYRIGFEIAGNRQNIMITLLCSKSDLPIIDTAFKSAFENYELSDTLESPLVNISGKIWQDICFNDYLPHPPFYNLLTQPTELKTPPLRSIIIALSKIESPVIGFYQVLFKPVSAVNDHHRQIEILLDIEYRLKLNSGFHSSQKQYSQQAPSGALQNMSTDLENKAHNDKPFYFTALRMGVVGGGNKGEDMLSSIAVISSLFQHGGRPLLYVNQDLYLQQMDYEQIRKMFQQGLVYRPGFLLNSSELTGAVQIPSLKSDEHLDIPIELLETLPPQNPELLSGNCIGTNNYAGMNNKICIPDKLRIRGILQLGKSGTYKSTTMIHIILNDIRKGHGVAVLDPHGDLIEELLTLLDKQDVDKTIYFDPGDPDWVPIWNPLKKIENLDVGRMTNDIVKGIESFAEKAWGDRSAHIFRNIIFSLISSNDEKSTFLNISNLLRNKSKYSATLRKNLMPMIDNETVLQFWREEYFKLNKELDAPINKISKLMISGTTALMLSQPNNFFDFKDIMDSGKIFLVNLSNIDTTLKQALGCFMISLFHLNALNRSNMPANERNPFHLHIDEAPNFITDSVGNIITETRKYKVSLNVAHQYKNQFDIKTSDALSTIGSTILFNCNTNDAKYYSKDLQDKVSINDLIKLNKGEAIARIGVDIVKINTLPPKKPSKRNYRNEIIERSREKYCKPAQEIKSWLKNQGGKIIPSYEQNIASPERTSDGKIKEYLYDEF